MDIREIVDGGTFSADRAAMVAEWAAMGVPIGQMAMALGIGVEALWKFHAADMNLGVLEANLAVARKIHAQALEGDRELQKFWARGRMGWADGSRATSPALAGGEVRGPRDLGLAGGDPARLDELCERAFGAGVIDLLPAPAPPAGKKGGDA
jgi:hypothetical protein